MASPSASSGLSTHPFRERGRFPWQVVATLLFVALFACYAWLWLVTGRAVGAALVVIPVLLLLSAPAIVWSAQREPSFDIAGLLAVGLLARFGGAYYRFTHAFDAGIYHTWGVKLAASFRNLQFNVDTGQKIPGTGGMRYVSGIVHVVANDDFFASFLLMAWLGFWGSFFLYRAFVTAVPDGDRYRYARLIMLWPSMVFWPSSLGKDGWMLFTLGLAALGAARVYRRVHGGYAFLTLGLLGASFVRPHAALLALLAFTVALVVGRRTATHRSTPSSVAKVAGLMILLVLGSVLITRTEQLLNIDELNSSSIDQAITENQERTAQGGSAFTPTNPRRPTGFPVAFVTVLFRPFPFEAHGLEQVVTAAEGVVLLLLAFGSLPRLRTMPGRLRSQPYVTFALVYVIMWVLVFGNIGNFGILARQRSSMLPFAFVLLSITARRGRMTPVDTERGAGAAR